MKKVLKKVFKEILFIFSILLLLNLFVVFYSYNNIDKQDYVEKKAILLLGCSVYGDRPSLMLRNRLDKAIEVYKDTNLPIIISGDQDEEKNYDEVSVMKNYLLTSEIPEDKIIEDPNGNSTMDSILNAYKEFNYTNLIIVTTKYHEYRSVYIGKKLGLNVIGESADNVNIFAVEAKNEIREFFARPKDFFKTIYVILTDDSINKLDLSK